MKNLNRRNLKIALAFFALALASCGLPGCGRMHWSGQTPSQQTDEMIRAERPADSGTFTSVYQTTLKNACIECHVPGGNAGGKLDFSSQAQAYTTLTTSTVSGGSSVGICGGVKIVDPGNPRGSYLAAVLFADYNAADFGGVAGCQPYSAHLQDQNLSADEKSSILAWIQNGAQNN